MGRLPEAGTRPEDEYLPPDFQGRGGRWLARAGRKPSADWIPPAREGGVASWILRAPAAVLLETAFSR